MFKNVSMNVKLSVPTIILCFVTAAVGWTGLSALSQVTDDFSLIANKSLPAVHASDEMLQSYQKVRIAVRTLGMTNVSPETSEQAIKDVIAAINEYDQADATYRKIEHQAEEKPLYAKVQTSYAKFKAVGEKLLDLQAQNTSEARLKMQDIFFVECPDRANDYAQAISALVSYHEKKAEQWSTKAREQSAQARATIIWVLGIGLLVGVVMAVISNRSASRLVKSISQIASGLSGGADELSQVSAQVKVASSAISSSATQQAAALQQTTAAVHETRAMVERNSENAHRSQEISAKSEASARRGKEAVVEVLMAIDQISSGSEEIGKSMIESNAEMEDVVKIISEIANKTKVINDIVFQTKLLSFNASVEAARAGESGKGFSVVAEEVGTLAKMSGASAKDISALLEESTQKVASMVEKNRAKVNSLLIANSERVKAGADTAKKCEFVLDEIVQFAGEVGGLVSQIALASQEQSNGMDEMTKAISELDSAAQQNSQSSHQSLSNADELQSQVSHLRGMITGLNSLVKAGDAGANVTHVKTGVVVPLARDFVTAADEDDQSAFASPRSKHG